MGLDPLDPKADDGSRVEEAALDQTRKVSPGVKAPPPSRDSVLQELIQQAMIGVLPTRRPLKPEEPTCFHSTHFAMIYDSLNGQSAEEIAERYKYSTVMVARIMAHPYTEVIEAALVGKMADDLTDPLARMRAYSHEAIDVKVQIMRDPSTPKTLRNSVAGDFLDRVGFGSRKVVTIEDSRSTPAVPEPLLERFANALEQSNEVRKLGYGSYVKSGGEGAGAVKVGSAGDGGALPTASVDSGGASPAGSPPSQDEKNERAA